MTIDATIGALLPQAMTSPTHSNGEDQDEQSHHNGSNDCSDDNDIGVGDVLEHSDALDVNLTRDAHAHRVVDKAVVGAKAVLVESQSDEAGHGLSGHLSIIALIASSPGE